MKRGNNKKQLENLESKLRINEGNIALINLGSHLDKLTHKHKWSEQLTADRIKLQIHKECVEYLENIVCLREQIERNI